MPKVTIIGAGGVGNVVAHKCAQMRDTFDSITLASRREASCREIAGRVREKTGVAIETAELDASDKKAAADFLKRERPDAMIHVALPYQDLALMEACLEAGVPYLDTANYESPDNPRFEYSWQWAYRDDFERAGIPAILGCGFDPGVTNAFCAHAQKHLFDRIRAIDILDANAGDHGYPFATNFNPEINIREITQNGRYWENGEWKETDPTSLSQTYDFPEIGPQDAYLIYHEELESLVQNIPGLERIRFWMTFSESYLRHLNVLRNVGMTSIEPIDFKGEKIVPMEFLKAVLPDPATLGPRTTGRTCIGCDISGEKDGREKRVFIYNTTDHQACHREVGSQAVSYTTGVPATLGAKLIVDGTWRRAGAWNIEQLDPDRFMEELPRWGLPWHVVEL